MREQERKISLAEVHTTIEAQGEIIFDQPFMELLGVQTGDWIAFLLTSKDLSPLKENVKYKTKAEQEHQ